jgi:hypothetical protein
MFIFRSHYAGRFSTLANVLMPLRASLARIRHKPLQTELTYGERFDEVYGSGQALIRNEDIDFALVHLLLPHPPAIYNRRLHRRQPGGSYIDNLAFADEILGSLEKDVSETQSAALTTLVISSDHSWRVPMWRGIYGWTTEEERASQGKFDRRPVLMVRFPAQDSAIDISSSFPDLKMHDMLEQLLAEKINSPSQLNAWAQTVK